jgi:hypothetical protein
MKTGPFFVLSLEKPKHSLKNMLFHHAYDMFL